MQRNLTSPTVAHLSNNQKCIVCADEESSSEFKDNHLKPNWWNYSLLNAQWVAFKPTHFWNLFEKVSQMNHIFLDFQESLDLKSETRRKELFIEPVEFKLFNSKRFLKYPHITKYDIILIVRQAGMSRSGQLFCLYWKGNSTILIQYLIPNRI